MSNTADLFPAGFSVPKKFGTGSDFVENGDFADPGPFDFTTVSTGTLVVNGQNGGVGRLSGAATTDDSGGQIQGNGIHAITPGKVIDFRARLKLSDATESDLYAGVLLVDTSIIASVPADGIFFRKDDGDTQIDCIVRTGGAENVAATAKGVADTSFHDFAIRIIPISTTSVTVEWYIDGVLIHSATGTVTAAAVLAPAIAFQSGTATGTIYVDIDYVGSQQDR